MATPVQAVAPEPTPNNKFEELCKQAEDLLLERRFYDAGKLFNEALKLDAGNARAFEGRRQCVEGLCDKGKELQSDSTATEPFDQALELDPTAAAALAGRSCGLRAQGEYDSAQRALNRGLFLYPSDEGLLEEQAQLYLDQEKWDLAVATLDRILQANPKKESAWVEKIRALRGRGQPFDEAEKAIVEAVEQCGKTPGILTQQARLLTAQGRYDEAVEAFVAASGKDGMIEVVDHSGDLHLIDAALDREPNNRRLLEKRAEWLRQRGRYREFVETYNHVLQIDDRDEGAHAKKIMGLRMQKLWREAEAAVSEALSKVPKSAGVAIQRGWLYYDQGEYDKSIEAFCLAGLDLGTQCLRVGGIRRYKTTYPQFLTAALDREPNNRRLLKFRAEFLVGQASYQEALEAYVQLHTLQPKDEGASRGMVRCLRSLKRFDAAREMLVEAGLGPQSSPALLNEAAKLSCDGGDYEGAVKLFNQAGDKSALVAYLSKLRSNQQFDVSLALVEAALKQNGSDEGLLLERASTYWDQERYEEAAVVFRRLLAIDPQNEDWHVNFIRLLRILRSNETEAAITEAMGILGTNARIIAEHALLYFVQGEYQKAIGEFDKCLSLWSDDEVALAGKIRSLRALLTIKKKEHGPIIKQIEEALDRLPKNIAPRERGLYLNDVERYPEAEKALRQALEEDASDATSCIALADCLSSSGKLDQALELLLKFPSPEDITIRQELGFLYVKKGEYREAREVFEKIQKDNPSIGGNGLACIHLHDKDYELAERGFRKALQTWPADAGLHTRLASALLYQVPESFSVRVAAADGPSWWGWLKKRRSAEAERRQEEALKRLEEAEECCTRALELDRNSARAYDRLGVIAWIRGRALAAEQYLTTAVELDPEDSSSRARLGTLQLQMGKYDAAECSLQKACELDQEEVRTRLILGSLYLQTDREKRALSVLQQSLALEPGDPACYCALAYALMQQKNLGEAESVLRKGLRAVDLKKSWSLHLALARLLTDVGDSNGDVPLYQEALQEVNAAIQLAGDRPEPYFYAGVVRCKLKDYPAAMDAFRRCLQFDPEHLEATKYMQRLKPLVQRAQVQDKWALRGGFVLIVMCLLLLVVVWGAFFWGNVFRVKGEITVTMLNILTPILLGLLAVGWLLPRIVQLTLPGMKAELSQPQQETSRALVGGVSFGAGLISFGAEVRQPRGQKPARPQGDDQGTAEAE